LLSALGYSIYNAIHQQEIFYALNKVADLTFTHISHDATNN
jgi:hypothetical protein